MMIKSTPMLSYWLDC